MASEPAGDLIASVLRGLHYEVLPETVVRWHEPGTMRPEGGSEDEWWREELSAWSEIPLADVCALAPHILHWRGFVSGDAVLAAMVETMIGGRDGE